MSIRETGVLVTGLGLEPENGLYTVGADRVDRIPFDSMEAVLITNVTAATVASVADVVGLVAGSRWLSAVASSADFHRWCLADALGRLRDQ